MEITSTHRKSKIPPAGGVLPAKRVCLEFWKGFKLHTWLTKRKSSQLKPHLWCGFVFHLLKQSTHLGDRPPKMVWGPSLEFLQVFIPLSGSGMLTETKPCLVCTTESRSPALEGELLPEAGAGNGSQEHSPAVTMCEGKGTASPRLSSQPGS